MTFAELQTILRVGQAELHVRWDRANKKWVATIAYSTLPIVEQGGDTLDEAITVAIAAFEAQR